MELLKLRHKARLRILLKLSALAVFTGYCYWQVHWLIRGRIAPSIFSYFTGLPNPGSGVSRSIRAALAGDYLDFLLWNPFTLPFIVLFIISFYQVAGGWLRNRKPALHPVLKWLWLGTLLVAWITKFILGKQYW